jgi:hypothetical protein
MLLAANHPGTWMDLPVLNVTVIFNVCRCSMSPIQLAPPIKPKDCRFVAAKP